MGLPTEGVPALAKDGVETHCFVSVMLHAACGSFPN